MKRLTLSLILLAAFCFASIAYAANLDDFNGTTLNKMWTLRDPASKGTVKFQNGLLVLSLKAGADMYIKGTDAGVMFLMDPPNKNDFSIDMKLNVATANGKQAPACHVGIVFFNEADWAYTAWGPYNAGADIRLEDCDNASYRWRDQTLVGIDPAKVAVDSDVFLKVTKTGNKLEFFAKGAAGDSWISGGTDEKLGPKYTAGKYKVGMIAKSWGGSVDSTFEFDYFNIPEITTTAVDASGKLATTWSSIKL